LKVVKIIAISLLIILEIMLGVFLWQTMFRQKPVPAIILCRYRMDSLYQGFRLYLKDHQGRFPVSWKADPAGWKQGLKGYFSEDAVFNCPKTKLPYVFNPQLAGKSWAEIKNSTETFILTEPRVAHGLNQKLYLFPDGRVKSIGGRGR